MRPFVLVLNPAFSFFLSQVSAFCQHLAPGCNYISEKSFKEDHFRTLPTTKQSVLASSAEWHPGFVTRKAAWPSVTEGGSGVRRWGAKASTEVSGGGWGGGGWEGKVVFIAICTIHQRKTKWTSVCNVPSWRSFKAWNSQILLKHMIQLTSIFKGSSLLSHTSR